jgi:hypothetical protein
VGSCRGGKAKGWWWWRVAAKHGGFLAGLLLPFLVACGGVGAWSYCGGGGKWGRSEAGTKVAVKTQPNVGACTNSRKT